MTNLRLGVLAYAVTRIESLQHYKKKLDNLVAIGAVEADVLVMPEYACMEVAAAFGGGADPVAELEAVCARSDDILEIMRDCAMRHNVWLQPGTIPFRNESGVVHNRAPLISPAGKIALQDKHVMTRFEAESWGVRSGTPPNVFETPWGRIGIAICYDSEFPSLVRAQIEAGAWLILVPTCTDTWHGFNRVCLSARARALENQCFVAVAPTVGAAPWLATLDDNHGRAGIYGPVDRGFAADGIIAEGDMDTGGWLFATLNQSDIEMVRAQGAVFNHRDWPATPPPSPTVTLI
jgi:predicted amidohydrolase